MRIVSRSSALAVLQAEMVASALRARWPDMTITLATRSSEGDRDRRLDLWNAASQGVFTDDLSQMVARGEADAAVHSWKDLPIDLAGGTEVAATLERADPRDVLLVRREVAEARPAAIAILTSSPRRVWQTQISAPRLLPWSVTTVDVRPVRGNIPTRLSKLTAGEGDGLVVAKAALDRLLSADPPARASASVRADLDCCRWMVLPLKEHPTAPAQGALAIEIASGRADIRQRVAAINHEPTWRAVQRERAILRSFGGGCHEAVGATALERDYGLVVSVRAHMPDGSAVEQWELETERHHPPPSSRDRIWPRRHERSFTRRRMLGAARPAGADAFLVTRAEALPAEWRVDQRDLIWAAGSRTWERLARRGLWVNGSTDGLGEPGLDGIDALAGRPVAWTRLTHDQSGDPSAVPTYHVDRILPDDLPSRTHFFWTSGSAFLEAVGAHPSIRAGWHASGPGRTARVIGENVETGHAEVWLDYDQWHENMTS